MSYDEPGGHQSFLRVELAGPPATLGDVDPLLMSEVIRDLRLATSQ